MKLQNTTRLNSIKSTSINYMITFIPFRCDVWELICCRYFLFSLSMVDQSTAMPKKPTFSILGLYTLGSNNMIQLLRNHSKGITRNILLFISIYIFSKIPESYFWNIQTKTHKNKFEGLSSWEKYCIYDLEKTSVGSLKHHSQIYIEGLEF